MPNWRTAEDYAYCKRLTVRGWAWEFLRRNEVYCQAWRERQDVLSAASEGGVSHGLASFAEWMAAQPYGLSQPVDPSLTAINAPVYWRSAVHVSVVQDWNYAPRGEDAWPGYPAKIALAFDFRQPLGPQIDEAVQILGHCEQHLEAAGLLPPGASRSKGRARVDKYAFYLRLLDAKSAGDTVYQIAKYFGIKWWTAKTAIRAAEELCAGGYRDLLRMSLKTTPK